MRLGLDGVIAQMPESQQDIDALLAEVNALAAEAVATIADGEPLAPEPLAPEPTIPATPAARSAGGSSKSVPPANPAPPRTRASDEPISPLIKSGRIPAAGQAFSQEDLTRILSIEVPIIVQLSQRTMPLSEILNLTTGSIIEFDKPADSELELRVNNKCVGSGQAVKVGENFGLRVVRIGTLRERIQALGT